MNIEDEVQVVCPCGGMVIVRGLGPTPTLQQVRLFIKWWNENHFHGEFPTPPSGYEGA